MQIVHLRLVNGDELVAQLASENYWNVTVLRPLAVDIQTDPVSGNQSIILSKYLLDTNESLTISKRHLLTKTCVIPEIHRYYVNSLKFNDTFIEKDVEERIRQTNDVMESQLFNHRQLEALKDRVEKDNLERLTQPSDIAVEGQELPPPKKNVKFIYPGSNTQH